MNKMPEPEKPGRPEDMKERLLFWTGCGYFNRRSGCCQSKQCLSPSTLQLSKNNKTEYLLSDDPTWQGPGQVIILENEPVAESVRNSLKPVEFTGPGGNRPGFYPNAEAE